MLSLCVINHSALKNSIVVYTLFTYPSFFCWNVEMWTQIFKTLLLYSKNRVLYRIFVQAVNIPDKTYLAIQVKSLFSLKLTSPWSKLLELNWFDHLYGRIAYHFWLFYRFHFMLSKKFCLKLFILVTFWVRKKSLGS